MGKYIQPFEHVCGEVDVSRFIDGCAGVDFYAERPKNFVELRTAYRHLNGCSSCTASLRTVLREHIDANREFNAQRVLKNVNYLSSVPRE